MKTLNFKTVAIFSALFFISALVVVSLSDEREAEAVPPSAHTLNSISDALKEIKVELETNTTILRMLKSRHTHYGVLRPIPFALLKPKTEYMIYEERFSPYDTPKCDGKYAGLLELGQMVELRNLKSEPVIIQDTTVGMAYSGEVWFEDDDGPQKGYFLFKTGMERSRLLSPFALPINMGKSRLTDFFKKAQPGKKGSSYNCE